LSQLGLFRTPNSAVFSTCGRYRYALKRAWGQGSMACWVLLNPSVADADSDDPTIRKITKFSRDWGFGGLSVGNLYGWRSTDPSVLPTIAEPIGPENDQHLIRLANEASLVILGWGVNAEPERAAFVVRLLQTTGKRLHCIGRNADSSFAHPLYKPGHLRPIPVEAP
jgi:hypothetical protein